MVIVLERVMPEQSEKKLHAESIGADIAAASDKSIDVMVHDSIDSTNSWSLQQCKTGKALPFACFAEQQTSGRGRRGKQWQMSANSNIAMSLSWSFALSHIQLHQLPLSIAMAVVTTLEDIGLHHVQVKWPNDVLVQGKKIAGILIETLPVNEKEIAVVIGVGLNYKMPELKIRSELNGKGGFIEITDIDQELSDQAAGRQCDRTSVASALLKNVVAAVQSYQSSTSACLEIFRKSYDYCRDKTVDVIQDDQQVVSGIAQGVNDNAELLVLIDGQQRVFNSAIVSVKAK